jgi:invasion protein IalB
MSKRSIFGLAGPVVVFSAIVLAGTASAQQAPPKAKAPAAAAPAAAAPAAASAAPSAWVKLCEKAPFAVMKDGKPERQDKNICLTHHEQLDANTGMVFVSAAIRQIEGDQKQHFMVMVPLGVALAPGLRTAIYTKDQWSQLEANKSIDDKSLKPIDLKFTICHPVGCTAEIEITPELLAQLKSGGGMRVLGINAAAQPVVLPVPLNGFDTALSGAPVDNAAFGAERAKVMQEIRRRQEAILADWKKQQEAAKAGAPAPAPGAPVATGSTPPPKKQ